MRERLAEHMSLLWAFLLGIALLVTGPATASPASMLPQLLDDDGPELLEHSWVVAPHSDVLSEEIELEQSEDSETLGPRRTRIIELPSGHKAITHVSTPVTVLRARQIEIALAARGPPLS